MTRTGTLVFSRCALLAALVCWSSIALAQTAAWQPTRSENSSSRSNTTARGAATPSRWLAPTQTSIRSIAGTANSANRPAKSAARQPKPFVPPADAKEIASPRSNNQSAARTGAGSRSAHSVAAKPQPRVNVSTSAAQVSASAARTNGTPIKSNTMAQRPPRANAQTINAHSRPRPTNSNRLFDDSWIRPLRQAAFESSEPEELYAPPENESQMHGPSGPEFYPEGEWIDSPEGAPYGGPCCDGQCGADCECGPTCGDGVRCGSTCGCASHGGSGSSSCYVDLGCGLQDPEACEEVRFRVPKIYTLLLSGGVHGFKGPLDRDRDSGNFGFQEGVNMGFKVPCTLTGYQIGYQTTQSQLSGDGDTGIVDAYSQHFLTAGVFRRNRDGFQGGVVWDLLLDERDTSLDFSQLRAELSFVDCGCHEVGGMMAVHLSEEDFVDLQAERTIRFQPIDQYLLFYRMHGKRGGEGRVFAGLSDDADGLVGADFLLPLTDCWSLQPSFTYLMPEESGGSIGAREEAWNIGISLVWHWKDQARSCHSSPYRPLFNVADNGSMIVDDRP